MNDRADGPISWAEIACLIRALGQKSFAEDCLRLLSGYAHTDHLGLFIFDRLLKPNLVAAASPPEKDITVVTAKEYARHYYMSDPNVSYISSHLNQSIAPLMFHMKASEITDDRYREQIYENKGLLERVSWIGIAGGQWFSANLYRDTISGYYSKDELDQLQMMGDLLCSAFEQHIVRILPDIPTTDKRPSLAHLQGLVTELQGGLSQREIEVCARALLGMTRNGIALDLDVKPSTVATLTQRAHSKLNISSLNELFALCLQVLTRRDDLK